MDILTLIIVGALVGLVVSLVVRGSRFGVVDHMLFGIVGAFIGGGGFNLLGWHGPLSGTAGVITVAFVGAVVVVGAWRLLGCLTRQPR
jgi:uncharacterized membrane protein YeaQ/YmgE (transglycosylase-associated protein family)